MDFYQIKSGNYSVEIDLNKLLDAGQLNQFKSQYGELAAQDEDFKALTTLRDGFLRYESETLLPLIGEGFKPKVLLVIGSPATHCVRNGMFFFSQPGEDYQRHGMWGRLAKAQLVPYVKCRIDDQHEARVREANLRKLMILSGTSSKKYLVGITSFYSLPMPVTGSDYDGVEGVEKLFGPVLDEIARVETERICSYPFTQGAALVFTQKSTHSIYSKLTGTKPEFWPLRGDGSGGADLAKIIAGTKAAKTRGQAPDKGEWPTDLKVSFHEDE